METLPVTTAFPKLAAARRVFSVSARDRSGHGHALAAASDVPGSTTALFAPPAPLTPVRGFRSRLIVRANSSPNMNKKGDNKTDLYICVAVCLVIKLYCIFKDKLHILLKAKAMVSGMNYMNVALTLFAIVKAIYGSLKLAKDIRELVKYYRSSKKTESK